MEDSNARVQIISLFIRISANRRFYANVAQYRRSVKVSNTRTKTLFFGLHRYRAGPPPASTLAVASPPIPPVPQVLLKALPQAPRHTDSTSLHADGLLASAAHAAMLVLDGNDYITTTQSHLQAGISPIPTLGISYPHP